MISRFTLVLVLILGVGTGCTSWSSRSAPNLPVVPAHDLLVDIQPFPDRWAVNPCEPACERDHGDIHAERSFAVPDVPGHVLQDVFRLESVAAAQAKFQTYREVDFRQHPPPQVPSSELLPPADVSYHSPIADEYYLGCGVHIVPACRAIIRYGNYFVSFFFDVNQGTADGVLITTDEGLEISDIEPILQALDQQVAARLGLPLPPPAQRMRTYK